MENLPPIAATRKTGDEFFIAINGGEQLTLRDFWQWSCSDLVSNATRGILAEYLVATALGLHKEIRKEWDSYDLKTPSGTRIEVKSAAYIQSWFQRNFSTITFGIRPTLAWDYKTNKQAKDKIRQANVYVFCLLHHKNQDSINPMDLSQWTFYVISTKQLEQTYHGRKSITLPKLKKLNPIECKYIGLSEAIHKVS